MAGVSDAHALVAALHRRAMVLTAAASGQHQQGLGMAAKRLGLGSQWKRRLREWDACLGLVEKITPESIDLFLGQLGDAIAKVVPTRATVHGKDEGENSNTTRGRDKAGETSEQRTCQERVVRVGKGVDGVPAEQGLGAGLAKEDTGDVKMGNTKASEGMPDPQAASLDIAESNTIMGKGKSTGSSRYDGPEKLGDTTGLGGNDGTEDKQATLLVVALDGAPKQQQKARRLLAKHFGLTAADIDEIGQEWGKAASESQPSG